MKIRDLTIIGFKNIRSLRMEDIPDLVVLAGPNGCGKTSVFDAIRLLKAIVGPYSSRELNHIQSSELRNELKHVVNLSADYADVECGISISQNERSYLSKLYPDLDKHYDQTGLLRASIRIQKNGSHTQKLTPPLSELLRHFDPTDEIGVIEYIPSNREITIGEISPISLGPDHLEREKMERTASAREKFHRLKYYLAMMVIYDKMQITETASKFVPEVQKFFKEFFYPKEFEGVKVDRSFRWQFPIATPDGTHDIDFLSSGEKEILMTYANILRMKLTESVILFDEPELHLNAALERKIIERVKMVVEAGNQIWLSTHSLEIIGTVPLDNLYKMHLGLLPGANNQIERCSARSDRFDALKLLGASIGVQLVSQRIIFVEGPSDKEVLERLYAEYGDRLSFVETRGLRTWTSLSNVVPELIDKVTAFEHTYLIRDRDLLEDEQVAEIESKFRGKVFVWGRRTIENYLLDSIIILKVLSRLGINDFSTADEVTATLRSLADLMKPNVLLDMVAFSLNKETLSPLGFPRVSSESEVEDTVLGVVESKKSAIVTKLQKDNLGLDTARQRLEGAWENKWMELVDGKELLQAFVDKCIRTKTGPLDLTHFRNLLVAEMKESGLVPEDVSKVMEIIVRGLDQTLR